MRLLKSLLSAGPIRPASTFSTRPGASGMRRWLLGGVAGLLFVLALIPLWDVWTINVAGTLVNRAIVDEAEPADARTGTPVPEAAASNGASAAADAAQGTAQARADLERAMALMEAAASRGPHTAAREIPIWRTYGAAASLAPSDRAFELLLRSRNAGRLDRLGELWLGEVASATEQWEVAIEAYRRIDASNLLVHRADMSLEAGAKELAVQQYLLARESLEAAIDRDAAEELLLDRTGNRPSATAGLLRPRAEQVISLYRIGRGLLSAGRPLDAVPVLEQASEKAKTASPGAVIEQSLALNLGLALARILPSRPYEPMSTPRYAYSDYANQEVMAHIRAVIRIRALVQTAIASDRTAPACVQAARIMLLIGDDTVAVSLFEEAIRLDPRLAEAYLGLGAWYEGKGMIILARALYGEGVRQLPTDPQLAAAYAIAAHRTLPAADALPFLEGASQMDTRDPYLFAHLGDCYADLGLARQARAAYEEGLRRAPDATPLLERLAALSDSTGGNM